MIVNSFLIGIYNSDLPAVGRLDETGPEWCYPRG